MLQAAQVTAPARQRVTTIQPRVLLSTGSSIKITLRIRIARISGPQTHRRRYREPLNHRWPAVLKSHSTALGSRVHSSQSRPAAILEDRKTTSGKAGLALRQGTGVACRFHRVRCDAATSKSCPKCGGPLHREPCLLGALYVCERCDRGDPTDAADPWINGELKPPASVKQTDPCRPG
jgi:hypothetical protein